MATIDIALDVTKPVHDIAPIFGRQGDTATVIRATILNDGEPYEFSGKYLEFAMVRPGEKSTNWIHIRDGVVQEGDTNVWNATLPAEATANDGLTKLAYFVVRDESDDGYRDSTERFTIAFDESATHTVKVTYYSDTVDRLIKECELLVEAWEAQMQAQQEAFQQAQDQRDQTFRASETSRDEAFQASESQRAQTFDASEAFRAFAFQQSESSRQATFDANEQQREAESDAAVQRANEAAQKVEEALSGDLSATFDGYLDEKKDVEGAFPSYETYLEGIKNAGTPDDVTLTKDENNRLLVKDDGVTTAKLADQAVTTEKVGDGAVTTGKLANDSVSSGKLANDAVTTQKLADKSVASAKIADKAIKPNHLNDEVMVMSGCFDWSKATAEQIVALLESPVYEVVKSTKENAFSHIAFSEIAKFGTLGIAEEFQDAKRDITFSGYGTHPYIVIGVNHDDLYDGSGKATFTLGPDHRVLQGTAQTTMMSSASTTGGWTTSNINSLLKNTIMQTLPADLLEVIAETKVYSRSSASSSSVGFSGCHLFIYSWSQLSGDTTYGDEGAQYDYWKRNNNNASRIHKNMNGNALDYWTRSIRDAAEFWYITSAGNNSGTYANSAKSIVPCFAIK